VAAGDVDGDGDIDVVVADDTTDDIALLRNTGGILAAPVRFPACDGAWAITLEDMDGDGDPDAVVACLYEKSVRVLRNNGAGSFSPWTGTAISPWLSPSRTRSPSSETKVPTFRTDGAPRDVRMPGPWPSAT
jgi:hypothetical protein